MVQAIELILKEHYYDLNILVDNRVFEGIIEDHQHFDGTTITDDTIYSAEIPGRIHSEMIRKSFLDNYGDPFFAEFAAKADKTLRQVSLNTHISMLTFIG